MCPSLWEFSFNALGAPQRTTNALVTHFKNVISRIKFLITSVVFYMLYMIL